MLLVADGQVHVLPCCSPADRPRAPSVALLFWHRRIDVVASEEVTDLQFTPDGELLAAEPAREKGEFPGHLSGHWCFVR